jgi:hypothetical protein
MDEDDDYSYLDSLQERGMSSLPVAVVLVIIRHSAYNVDCDQARGAIKESRRLILIVG